MSVLSGDNCCCGWTSFDPLGQMNGIGLIYELNWALGTSTAPSWPCILESNPGGLEPPPSTPQVWGEGQEPAPPTPCMPRLGHRRLALLSPIPPTLRLDPRGQALAPPASPCAGSGSQKFASFQSLH